MSATIQTMHKKAEIVYPELSYKIVGVLFDAFNSIGYGHVERVYQSAVAEMLRRAQLRFSEQVYAPVVMDGKTIGRYFLDFLIEDRIILELKQGAVFLKGNIGQVNAYLKSTGLQLAILANFTPQGVSYRRLVNIHPT